MRPIQDYTEAKMVRPGPIFCTPASSDVLTGRTAELEDALFCDVFIFGYHTAGGGNAPTGDGQVVGNSFPDDDLALAHKNCASAVPYSDAAAIAECFVGDDDVPGSQEAGISAAKFSELPPPERIQRYLVVAEHARCEAVASKDASVRQSYLFIAEQWQKFALDLALYSARKLRIDMSSKRGPKH